MKRMKTFQLQSNLFYKYQKSDYKRKKEEEEEEDSTLTYGQRKERISYDQVH